MSDATSLAFPGGRTLAAWWRQLAIYAPERFWAGYLTFQRLECPVLALQPQRLPPLEALVLKALAIHTTPVTASALAGWLHLETALIESVLRFLQREGLIAWQNVGASTATEAGRHTVEHGEYFKSRYQARVLHLWDTDVRIPTASSFVHLPHPERVTWLPSPIETFAIDRLRACFDQSVEWKG